MQECVKPLEEEKDIQCNEKINFLHQWLEWFQSRQYPYCFMINMVKKELTMAYKEEELFCKQKSRDKWFHYDDRNSKFFHASVKMNRSRNQVLKLKNKDGQEQWSEGAKEEVALEYFSELFRSSNPRSYDPVFLSLISKVSDQMNLRLMRDVSVEEVREAMFSINPDSAPGPDGMIEIFFQKFWNVIGTRWHVFVFNSKSSKPGEYG